MKAYAVYTLYKSGHIARNTCKRHCFSIFPTRKEAEAECLKGEEVVRVEITIIKKV
jgi:hypothetical protein